MSPRPCSLSAPVPRRPMGSRGFSLPELLVALCLGLLFAGVVLRLLLAEGDQGARLARLARERLGQKRALALIRADLRRAIQLRPEAASLPPACPMSGRRLVLQLRTETTPVTYALGPAPSPIWRGWVLLRCGPAFGLYGEPSAGDSQNRVLLDGLAPTGFRAEPEGEGLLRLRLEQRLALPGGALQRIASELTVASPQEAAAGPSAPDAPASSERGP